MKTNRNNLVAGLIIAIALLCAAPVQADLVTSGSITGYGVNDVQAYFDAAGQSDWVFGNFSTDADKATTDGVRHLDYTFDVINKFTGDVVGGLLSASDMNGWGGNLSASVLYGGSGVSLSHNTAHAADFTFSVTLDMLIADNFIDSFYIYASPHDASNGYVLNVEAIASDGSSMTQTTYDPKDGFFGFTLDEGYFERIVLSIYGGKPNGGFDAIVGLGNDGVEDLFPGVEPSPVPEPATLAIIGLGLAGLGLARARRRK